MKKHIIFLIALIAMVISCKDEALDPLQINKIKKGTDLALRGNALDKFYWGVVPITSMLDYHLQAAPAVATGNETFAFDAEYLSENPTSLASVDLFVLKPYTGERIALTTIDGSQFAVGAYPKPSSSISIKLTDMLAKLGLANTIPLPAATVDSLLNGSYGGDITVEADLNLKDGRKILAAEMVASGLYQSDQFYPAMSLPFHMDEFCAYSAGSWAGTYASGYSTGNYYADNLTVDGSTANRYHIDNFLNKGYNIYFDMSPSTNPYNQTITIPSQTTPGGVVVGDAGNDPSTYDQCSGTINLNLKYTATGKSATTFSISIAKP